MYSIEYYIVLGSFFDNRRKSLPFKKAIKLFFNGVFIHIASITFYAETVDQLNAEKHT